MMYQINPLTDCRNYSLGFKHPVDHILLSPDYGRIAVFYGRLEVGIIVHGSREVAQPSSLYLFIETRLNVCALFFLKKQV